MEVSHISQEYIQAVKDIKSAILRSRYQAAKLANKELLKLTTLSVAMYLHTVAMAIGARVPLMPLLKHCNKSCQD